MKAQRFFILMLFFALSNAAFTQPQQANDSIIIRKFYDAALMQGKCYQWLDYLSNQIGGRLSGSPQAQKAIQWAKMVMDTLKFDKVYLQEVMVPYWVRGKKEEAKIISKKFGKIDVHVCALGNSVGTDKKGVTAQVIEVKGLNELEKLGKEKIEGKIVFYNRPMEPRNINTFVSYGQAVDQRALGASEAAKYGAVGVVVRSMTLAHDNHPHTGSLRYDTAFKKLPAVAISTNDADKLSEMLKKDPELKFYFKTDCRMMGEVLSYNVIGEIRGTLYPNEIVLVGGHLDSWDNGDGAHDDGAGCVHAIESLRLFQVLGIRPKRTLRAVLFMNEENGLRGGLKYAEVAAQNSNEKHIAAIESDAGGFTPRGFGFSCENKNILSKMLKYAKYFEPYGLYEFKEGGGGADISPLKNHQKDIVLIGYIPDSQRYFDYHHAEIDTFANVNRRELELGAGSIAALLYLLSEYGTE
ncbi:MAG: M28 family peptidase [Bacteroidia bacterium]|nr:M28 family peptidase [Bacteroidia bacterium]MDW8302184.1 M28 family peptidase [Bacteroidia bacterium]